MRLVFSQVIGCRLYLFTRRFIAPTALAFSSYTSPRPKSSELMARRRTKRFLVAGASLAVLGLCIFGLMDVFEDGLMFYLTPTQVLERQREGQWDKDKLFRLGGIVMEGSLISASRKIHGVLQPEIRFVITDYVNQIPVIFVGVPPDMFKEKQGAVCQGKLRDDGLFEAKQILAKHDERYMPPSIAKELKDYTNVQGLTKEELGEKIQKQRQTLISR
jgi:cytochrome c-type biogenesis protein CcmE